MKQIIQIHLEHKTDVIREIEILSNNSLKDLHNIINKTLKLESNQMASFYKTNEEFELLQEIPLFKIDEKDKPMPDMSEITISSAFPKVNSKLIYIYDFLKMWRFLATYSRDSINKSKTNRIIKNIGDMPMDAPEVIFEADSDFEKESDIYNESEY